MNYTILANGATGPYFCTVLLMALSVMGGVREKNLQFRLADNFDGWSNMLIDITQYHHVALKNYSLSRFA